MYLHTWKQTVKSRHFLINLKMLSLSISLNSAYKVYKAEKDLKNIYIVPVNIKNKNKLSFTYRYKTKIVKNYDIEQALEYLFELIGPSFLKPNLKPHLSLTNY